MEGLREFLIAASKGGGRNFRTIRDWDTLDGRRVLSGRVYRSGHLGNLTDEVRSEVGGLGVRTVVTFQTRQEIDILGDPLEALLPDVRWEHIPIGDRWFEKGSLLLGDTESQGRFYVAMVRDHKEEWGRFLRLFAESERFSVIYHCTAGRDRTGVATVLLLEALRVPRPEILADYLVSNEVFPESLQGETVLDPLFRAVDEAGGIDAFLGALGLSAPDIAALRANLVA